MIYVVALCLAMIDPFCDVVLDVAGDVSAAMPVDTESDRKPLLDVPIIPLVAKEEIVEASCESGNCRVRESASTDTSLGKSDARPAPARRFRPLRRLFGR